METIGGRIAALRVAKEMTQTALAQKIGVKPSAISMIETGVTRSLAGATLAGLCEALGTTPEYILHGGAAPDPERAVLEAEITRLVRSMSVHALRSHLISAQAVVRLDANPPPVKDEAAPLKQIRHTHERTTEIREQGRVGRNVRAATKRARAEPERNRQNAPRKKA